MNHFRKLALLGGTSLVAFAVAAAVAGAHAPEARAYGSAGGSWNSLGCIFSGNASADYYTGVAKATTYRWSSCANYAMVAYDYFFAGQWYGTFYNYCYNSYTNACQVLNGVGASQVYSYHQIYTSGAWRQIQNLYVP